jgi:hypothetical protein
MKGKSLVAIGATLTTLALSSLLASSSEGKSYYKYTSLICSVNPTDPTFPVIIYNKNPANSVNYPAPIAKGTKIYWNSGTHKGNVVLPYALPPGAIFVTGGHLPSYALCHASSAVCTAPPTATNQKSC